MKDSLKNTFPLDGKKAYGLYHPEVLFALHGMEHSLNNRFALYGKTASSVKKSKILPTSRKIFFW